MMTFTANAPLGKISHIRVPAGTTEALITGEGWVRVTLPASIRRYHCEARALGLQWAEMTTSGQLLPGHRAADYWRPGVPAAEGALIFLTDENGKHCICPEAEVHAI